MKNRQWEAIHDIFRKLEELLAPFGTSAAPSVSSASSPSKQEIAVAEPGAPQPTVEDLVQARAQIRAAIDRLREALSLELSERDVYFVLFPIVAHFDELVQTRYVEPTQVGGWPPLQRELFDTDEAGELFYTTLDDILMKSQTLPLIFEVYYFCLSDGFRGRFVDAPSKRQEFMERLRGKIPRASVEPEAPPSSLGEDCLTPLPQPRSPIWYYAGAGVLVVLFYFLLRAVAESWNPLL